MNPQQLLSLPSRTTKESKELVKQLIGKEGADLDQALKELHLSDDRMFSLVATAIETDIGRIDKMGNAIDEDVPKGTDFAVKLIHAELLRGLVKELTDSKPSYGYRLIHHAAAWGHVPVIEAYAAIGGDLNSTNSVGSAPLHFAAGNLQLGAVTALIANGADPVPFTFKTEPLHKKPAQIVTPEQTALAKGGVDFQQQYLAAVDHGRQLRLEKQRAIEPAVRLHADVQSKISENGTGASVTTPAFEPNQKTL